jgi:hypothetical protein
MYYMKQTMILAAIVAGLAMQALAADPVNKPSASTSIRKNPLQQRVNDLLQPKTVQNYKIDRVGGISSRPWSQTAANYSAGTPLFTGDRERYHDVQFALFWTGAPPP